MIDAIAPIKDLSVYYENRISYEQKWEMNGRTMSIIETPHITYDKNGNLIETPDKSFNLGPKYV